MQHTSDDTKGDIEIRGNILPTLFLHRREEWDAAPLRAEAGPVPATAAGVAVLLPRLALHSLKGNIALLEAAVKVDVGQNHLCLCRIYFSFKRCT